MWLDSLRIELENLMEDDLIDSPHEIASDETVVATASMTLRKLYTLVNKLNREGKQELGKHIAEKMMSTSPGNMGVFAFEAEGKLFELTRRHETLNEVFWICVRDEYGLWDSGHVGLRRGFKVVTFKGR